MSEIAEMIGDITILPPYVEPEHRVLIEKAESMLSEYEKVLIKQLKSRYNKMYFGVTDPAQEHIRMMEQEFHTDPIRMALIKQLTNIKLICEETRIMIKPHRGESDD